MPSGTMILDAMDGVEQNEKYPILAAKVNNKLHSLKYRMHRDCRLEFITYRDREGVEVYRRSLCTILALAIQELRSNTRLVISHSLGNAYYYDYYTDIPVSERLLAIITDKMNEIIERDEPIERQVVTLEEARKLFAELGQSDKTLLLSYCELEKMAIYTCGTFVDIGYGPLVPSAGYIRKFKLKPYHHGFLLIFPEQETMEISYEVKSRRKLFQTYHEQKKWGKILEVNNVGRLNDKIHHGEISELIKVAEALHEKKLAAIADEITKRKDDIRLVLIAGPSSSGKTTFSKRLTIHLKATGLRPVALSLDNYFVDREHTPRDEEGNYDFEHLEALDLELFNEHLTRLLEGKEVGIPKFSFSKGRREEETTPLRIDDDQILIIEGIHGLNPRLTYSVPAHNKFKIFVSCLTQLSIDDYNRIPTTDTRCLRRMVRDEKFRGYGAAETLSRWPSVRRGEERWIFPFQEEADVMFNSALTYELCVLKRRAVPLLKRIPREHEMYNEARRLLRFLAYFQDIEKYEPEIPPTSILREFIGGSSFHY